MRLYRPIEKQEVTADRFFPPELPEGIMSSFNGGITVYHVENKPWYVYPGDWIIRNPETKSIIDVMQNTAFKRKYEQI